MTATDEDVIHPVPVGSSDDGHAFAARANVGALYKLRGYDTDERREWVRQILVEHRVYFSRSSQLNDADDLRPC